MNLKVTIIIPAKDKEEADRLLEALIASPPLNGKVKEAWLWKENYSIGRMIFPEKF